MRSARATQDEPFDTPARPSRTTHDERGQVSVLIVGFAVVILMLIAVVVDATAAYIQRQGLATLADGAALRGADLGATGEEVYTGGVGRDRLDLTRSRARGAVADYLRDVGAHARYPGLSYQVRVDPASERVTVRLQAPLELPLTFPGSPATTSVGATGSAVVQPDPG